MQHPFLIIGQGLAGTALAWRLRERGVPFRIVDRGTQGTCSQIAAGLMTPIAGMRLNLSWRYPELYPQAQSFYQDRERELGLRFFHPIESVRVFRDQNMQRLWHEKRRYDAELTPYLTAGQHLLDESFFRLPWGGFEQTSAAYVDTQTYLTASRDHLRQLGCWQQAEVSPESLNLRSDRTVDWDGNLYSIALFCQGWEAALHPWFDWMPFQNARGSIVDLRADLGGESRGISGPSCWLLPLADGRLRAGPTYEVPFDPAQPHTGCPNRMAALKTRVESMLVQPLRWGREQTAVRPIIGHLPMLMGRHPARPQIAFLNGLGSKGVLRAPWAATHLLDHLIDGTALDHEVDLAQNL